MTSGQVLRWFCKEQGIIPLMYRMYYKMNPYRVDFGTKYKKVYMTFDEYIDSKVCSYGFAYVFDFILGEYKSILRAEIPFGEYYDFSSKLDEKIKPFIRRWTYFVKNNVELQNELKRDDTISFDNWGHIRKLKISKIDIQNGRVYGKLIDDEFNGEYCVFLRNLLDENLEQMKLNYIIKRNRKVYGLNSK